MEISRIAMLLLVQLSPIFVFTYGETATDYMCSEAKTTNQAVSTASAQLTNGCTLTGSSITFDIKAMAAAAKSPPASVVIDITQAVFTNSYIKLINDISGDPSQVPLLFTMRNSQMSGNYRLEFGDTDKDFKLPPHSHIRIVDSQLIISSTDDDTYLFHFHSLQLLTDSSMEISRNVITMACSGTDTVTDTDKSITMSVFYLPDGSHMKVSGKSSFTLRDNTITLKGHTSKYMNQYVWYHLLSSSLTISQAMYTWASNIISIEGHDTARGIYQYVFSQDSDSHLYIYQSSTYTWSSNIISIVGYNIKEGGSLYQYVFQETNSELTISGGSRMVWKGNCIGMGDTGTNTAKKPVLYGIWHITDEGSELLLDGNSITTTDKYTPVSDKLKELVWKPTGDTGVTDGGTLTIQNTKVITNNAANGETGSIMWKSPLFTSKVNVNPPDMKWSSSLAYDGSGSPIPTLDRSNLRQYMCIGLPTITPTITATPTITVPSPPVPEGPTEGPTTPDLIVTKPNPGGSKPVVPAVRERPTGQGSLPTTAIDQGAPVVTDPKTKITKPEPPTSLPPGNTAINPIAPTAQETNRETIPQTTAERHAVPQPVTPKAIEDKPPAPVPEVTKGGGTGPSKPKPIGQTPTVTKLAISPSPDKADSNTTAGNGTTTTSKVKSATAILSTTPGVLITSVVFLYLYYW